MPQRKTRSPYQNLLEWMEAGFPEFEEPHDEPDAINTPQALHKGNLIPLRAYVRDLGANLARLADLLDPKEGKEPHWRLRDTTDQERPDPSVEPDDPTPPEAEEEWIGSTSQAREAIESGSRRCMGWYFREAARILYGLQSALDQDPHSPTELKLIFKHRKPGKPKAAWKQMEKSAIRSDVEGAHKRSGKKEAAIAEVQEKKKLSRATVYRDAQPPKKK
jgi:hypothetical protein